MKKEYKVEIELNEELYNFYKLASDNDKMTLEDGIVAVLYSFYKQYKKKYKKKYKIGK
ncbi:MAG: hypothetical protein IJY25_03065 [Bacilli bacterium]|nr:hypothetical protein [Bacilli bacterium]